MKYKTKRPFYWKQDVIGKNEPIEMPKRKAQRYLEKGLIVKANYATKEEKQAYKCPVTIEHDAGPMFYVKRGAQILDRLPKKEAEAKRDRLNAK